jgi:hypothetical protein
MQLLNNNGQFLNQQINLPQQTSTRSHPLNTMLNQQPRFPSVQQTLQPRMPNPQPGIPNQLTRLREPQKYIQRKYILKYFLFKYISLASNPPNLSQTYPSQSQQVQQIPNVNLNDYLSQSSTLQNRYPVQPLMSLRPRVPTNLNGFK